MRGYSNPAFKALGIPTIKLPSRNWLIFWTVLTTGLSGIVYDKYQQRSIISHYTDLVKPFSKEPLPVQRKPRKITVFIAPPPNDYLDTSLKIWRRYIKPVLYYAGLDYDVVEEDRQGVIRTKVASELRQLRLQLSEKKNGSIEHKHDDDEESSTKEKQELKADPSEFLGVFYKKNKVAVEIIPDDCLVEDPKMAGGVICIGRGAYKEYLTGLHEGLLGPLEEPAPVTEPTIVDPTISNPVDDVSLVEQELQGNLDDTIRVVDTLNDESSSPNLEDTNDSKNKEEKKEEKEEGEEKEKEKETAVIVKPFITSDKYSEATIPSELEQLTNGKFAIKDPNTNIPILLHQPLLMIPIPNLSGFTNMPRRIARFYQRREYASRVCSETYHLVTQENMRKFDQNIDTQWGKEEEEDYWPSQWVKQGLERKSEWTRPLITDPKVVDNVTVIDH
ncbi:Tim22-complex subunit TIM54 NDAI_0G05820 [Naumovozyma dairenensis CBS 421]|uniref:Mitochondrial import inner membrane translocase subunit TIM54 n=1 Tax=Naumovozyma dairenensis (strain ATCC 10597 / BCRC 20456 / CBS 421 / NBRC 0211 / NRRL Y-12639) TaxID=1071378 RepID=J7SBU1_NAUDC|nr:hypothetical protein NDAI_0G05820 [Naumovozyma dairenensis CBS 421]CCK73565.1 hypothetical protein NDAI_0G05820 [Naumovozyma dairenensis CBS 421]